MQCVTPMFYVYPLGDKKKGKIVPRQEVMQGLQMDPNNIRNQIALYNKVNSTKKAIEVPCNYCWACQLKYSAEWATRIMLEAQKYENNYFITLTYDDEHLFIPDNMVYEDGTFIENDGTWTGTLVPEDMQKFIKHIRNYMSYHKKHEGIKYFYCGEYGEHTNRPHYHLILLNCPLDIEQFYDTFVDGNYKAHWKSKEVEIFWKNGMIDIAELEWSAAAYVARYCTKKISLDPDKNIYYKQGKIPEYIRMSKGIGMDYFNEHMDEIYKNDEIIAKTVKGNIGSIKPPRAFDKKYAELDPKGFEMIKKSRQKAAERARKLQAAITDYTDLNKLVIDTEKIKLKMSMLPRSAEI